ncbi:hypothetical protein MHYP_G00319440 [Metynnis hypsauchen]
MHRRDASRDKDEQTKVRYSEWFIHTESAQEQKAVSLGSGGEVCSAAEFNGLCAGQREMDSCVALILLSSTISLTTAGVRLVGGSRCSGRVEVLHGETWSTVCDADFDQQDAEVVCRELGCGLPVEVLGAAAFGRGEGQVWSEELLCRGNKSQIHFCPSSSLKHNCSHDSDVRLVCAGVRLVGGSRCSGRVEVLHGETWSTVCDADFDQQDAEVVCRELGCGLPVEGAGSSCFWQRGGSGVVRGASV